MQTIPDHRGAISYDQFHNEILPAAKPVIFRGLVSHWRLTQAGLQSPEAVWNYIRPFDPGYSATSVLAPPSAGGRFFYNDDITGFTFRHGNTKLGSAFDFWLGNLDEDNPSSLAIQSVPVRSNLPGLEPELPMPLLRDIEPRVWLGNAGIVAAHHDPSENIACVVAGQRRFTLFPPDQLENLYVGPWDFTPAGAAISMVSLEQPDLARYPRFAEALKAAQTAELLPGDAIFIPYHWWHHVRSFKPFNMLVNYWWQSPLEKTRGSPREAFVHALMAIKDLPPHQREGWRTLFEHYIFKPDGDPLAHLPVERHGVLGEMDQTLIQRLRGDLAQVLRDRDR